MTMSRAGGGMAAYAVAETRDRANTVIASEAKQSISLHCLWIASSLLRAPRNDVNERPDRFAFLCAPRRFAQRTLNAAIHRLLIERAPQQPEAVRVEAGRSWRRRGRLQARRSHRRRARLVGGIGSRLDDATAP